MRTLHIRTWLAPSVPLAYIEAVGALFERTLGINVDVSADTSCSGPSQHSVDPLTGDGVDIGLMCSPPYKWLAGQKPAGGVLLPAIHVFDDTRNHGQPLYFADIYVRTDAAYASFDSLRQARFAYNDSCSLSGYLGIEQVLAARGRSLRSFFGSVESSGGHRESLAWLQAARCDVCSVDSNAMRGLYGAVPPTGIRRLCALGPFPVQPFVCRPGLDPSLIQELSRILLQSEGQFAEFGVLRHLPCGPEFFEVQAVPEVIPEVSP